MFNFQKKQERDIYDNQDAQIYSCPKCQSFDVTFNVEGTVACCNPSCPSLNKEIKVSEVKKIDVESFKEKQVQKEIDQIESMKKIGITVELNELNDNSK